MARQPRQEIPGGIHHVTARGNGRAVIFDDERDRRFFLGRLESVVADHGLTCLSICLMDNHFHLVLETPEANLGLAMGRLLTRYAQGTNHRRGTSGHVLGDRFHSVPVATERHLLCLLRYVALNPVTAGMCARPDEWPWSSHTALLLGVERPHAAAGRVRELLAAAGSDYAALFDESGPLGPWSNATVPDRLRPPLEELVGPGAPDEALIDARWGHAYTLAEIAAAAGVGKSTVARRTAAGRK